MNHQCSGWSRVADSTPARIVGKSASRMPIVRIMSKYKRNMRICEAIFTVRHPQSRVVAPLDTSQLDLWAWADLSAKSATKPQPVRFVDYKKRNIVYVRLTFAINECIVFSIDGGMKWLMTNCLLSGALRVTMQSGDLILKGPAMSCLHKEKLSRGHGS